MKLRLYRDSLRLRLTPAEVRQLRDGGAVRDSTGFAPGVELVCWLSSDGDREVSARLEGNTLEVQVPRARVHEWARSEEVGIRAVQQIGPGRSLAILIEKDFECMHDGEATAGETFYPNPVKARC